MCDCFLMICLLWILLCGLHCKVFVLWLVVCLGMFHVKRSWMVELLGVVFGVCCGDSFLFGLVLSALQLKA